MTQYFKLIFKNGIAEMVKTMEPPPKFNRPNRETKTTVAHSALNGYFKQTFLDVPQLSKSVNLETYLSKFKPSAAVSLSKNVGYKAILSVCVKMTNGEQTKRFYFNSSPHVIQQLNNKQKLIFEMIQEVLNNFYKKDYEGSGWTFLNFDCVSINYGKYNPFKGGCGNNKLPNWLSSKHALICILSGDDYCFYWCILRHFNPRKKDKGRVTKDLRKIQKEKPNQYADFTDINFPTSANDLELFQNRNPHIHLIVYGVDKINKRTPVIFDEGKKGNAEKIFLLFYEEHYYLIADLSRLLSSQLSNHHGRLYFCYKCQRGFKDENVLNKHLKNCTDITLLQLPEEDSDAVVLEFKAKQDKPPNITVYFDFESFLIPFKDTKGNKTHKHEPSGFCFVVVSSDEKIYQSRKISHVIQKEGQDVAALFVKKLMDEIQKANTIFFNSEKASNLTPVLCHNLSGYDAHLCILKLAEYSGRLSVLPSNEEKYISFSKYCYINNKQHEIRFLDSYKFLSSPLSQLVDDTNKNNFKFTASAFPGVSIDMLTRKGVYPYEEMNGFEKTKLTRLPPVENFYSTL